MYFLVAKLFINDGLGWFDLIMNWVNTLYDHTKVFLKVLKKCNERVMCIYIILLIFVCVLRNITFLRN